MAKEKSIIKASSKKEFSPIGAVAVTSSSKSENASPRKDAAEDFRYDTSNLSVIASPLASEKLVKKLYKVVKKATKSKQLKRGVKEVVKAIRKGTKGMVMLAGDVNPVDVITHIPVLCEENSIPYVYVPEKCVLGWASGSKRPTSCIMICPYGAPPKAATGKPQNLATIAFEYKDKFDECVEKIKDIPIPML